jgi:hypothetical protein
MEEKDVRPRPILDDSIDDNEDGKIEVPSSAASSNSSNMRVMLRRDPPVSSFRSVIQRQHGLIPRRHLPGMCMCSHSLSHTWWFS